jgi:hypothetical protein
MPQKNKKRNRFIFKKLAMGSLSVFLKNWINWIHPIHYSKSRNIGVIESTLIKRRITKTANLG